MGIHFNSVGIPLRQINEKLLRAFPVSNVRFHCQGIMRNHVSASSLSNDKTGSSNWVMIKAWQFRRKQHETSRGKKRLSRNVHSFESYGRVFVITLNLVRWRHSRLPSESLDQFSLISSASTRCYPDGRFSRTPP